MGVKSAFALPVLLIFTQICFFFFLFFSSHCVYNFECETDFRSCVARSCYCEIKTDKSFKRNVTVSQDKRQTIIMGQTTRDAASICTV